PAPDRTVLAEPRCALPALRLARLAVRARSGRPRPVPIRALARRGGHRRRGPDALGRGQALGTGHPRVGVGVGPGCAAPGPSVAGVPRVAGGAGTRGGIARGHEKGNRRRTTPSLWFSRCLPSLCPLWLTTRSSGNRLVLAALALRAAPHRLLGLLEALQG